MRYRSDSVRILLTSAHSVQIRDWRRSVLAGPLYRSPVGLEMNRILHKADGDDGPGGSTDNGDRLLLVAHGRGHQFQQAVSMTGRWWLALTMAVVPARLRR